MKRKKFNGIFIVKYGIAMLRIGKVVLNSQVRVCSSPYSSPGKNNNTIIWQLMKRNY